MLQLTVWVVLSAHTHLSTAADIRVELASRKAADVLCCVQSKHESHKVCSLRISLWEIVGETAD